MRPFGNATKLLLSTPAAEKPDSAPVPFQYWSIAEVVDGWALLGEISKFITASTRRVTSVKSEKTGNLLVRVAGIAEEKVTLCAVPVDRVATYKKKCETEVIGADGVAEIRFSTDDPHKEI